MFFVKNYFFYQQNINTYRFLQSYGLIAEYNHLLISSSPRGCGVRSSRLTPGYQALAPNGAALGRSFNILGFFLTNYLKPETFKQQNGIPLGTPFLGDDIPPQGCGGY